MYSTYRQYHKFVFTAAILCIILLFSRCDTKNNCSGGTQNEIFDHVEAQMLEYPEQLDSLIPKIDTLHLNRCDSARYFLIKGFYNARNGHYAKSIHEISISEAIFSDLGDDYYQHLNSLVKAFTFEYLNLDNDAAGLYLSCNKYFKEKKLEKLKIYSTLGLIRLSNVINLDKTALINEAKENITKLNDPVFGGLYYSTLGNIEKNDSVKIHYYELAKRNFLLAKSWHRAYAMEINQLFPKFKLDHSDRMEQHYWQLRDNYQFYKPIEFLRMRYRYAQGYLYAKQGKTKEAILTFEKILNELESKNIPEITLDCIKFLAVLNIRIGNFKEASDYQYRQSDLEKENKEVLRQNQILALSSHYRFTELEQEKLAFKLKYKNTFFLLCIISLIFAIILSAAMFLLKQSQLKREIVMLRNVEIEEQFVNLSKSLESEKNKNQNLIDKVKDLSHRYKDSRSITRLKMAVEQGEMKLWKDFDERFLELRHVWVNNLKEQVPGLTDTEIRYCKCLYMEFSNANCAAICCVTFDTIRSAKKRLKKKLSLKEDANLYEYLRSFE